MTYNDSYSDKFFSHSHRKVARGTFILGASLFLLAVFIFAFPALIAYFIAGVILVTGISVLTVAWKFWRFREQVSRFETTYNIKKDGNRTHIVWWYV